MLTKSIFYANCLLPPCPVWCLYISMLRFFPASNFLASSFCLPISTFFWCLFFPHSLEKTTLDALNPSYMKFKGWLKMYYLYSLPQGLPTVILPHIYSHFNHSKTSFENMIVCCVLFKRSKNAILFKTSRNSLLLF